MSKSTSSLVYSSEPDRVSRILSCFDCDCLLFQLPGHLIMSSLLSSNDWQNRSFQPPYFHVNSTDFFSTPQMLQIEMLACANDVKVIIKLPKLSRK